MRLLIRRVLNLLLYLSFCMMVGTGMLMAFRLIPGNRGGRGLTVLGWNRHQWGDLHTWISYAFIALVVLHLILNWAWLTKVAARGNVWQLIIGLLTGIAIISAFLFLPLKEREKGKRRNSAVKMPMIDQGILTRNFSLEIESISHRRKLVIRNLALGS